MEAPINLPSYLLFTPPQFKAADDALEAYRKRMYPFKQREEQFRASIGPPPVVHLSRRVIANLEFMKRLSSEHASGASNCEQESTDNNSATGSGSTVSSVSQATRPPTSAESVQKQFGLRTPGTVFSVDDDESTTASTTTSPSKSNSKDYQIQIDKDDENVISNSSVMSLLFLLDFCVAILCKQTFKWKVKGSVKMTPVEKETCKFAIPESFKLGHYLKEKFDIFKVKSKRSLALTKIPAGQENVIKICFNYLIVLCDRIMKTNSAHFGKLRLHPRLQDFFSDEDKDEFPDFATAHQPKELIKDQSRVFNWKPSWCRVAALSSDTVTQEEEEQENAEEEKRKRDQLAKDDGKQDEHDTNAMLPSAKKPRRLYALELESLFKKDEQVAANNDDDDTYGHLPSLQKSPKKCRLRLLPKKKSPAKKKKRMRMLSCRNDCVH